MNRRQLIGRSAALVTSFAVGRHLARAADRYPFTLGVASGEPTEDGFVLWTRLALVPLALDGSAAYRIPSR
jgi:alkaline phosphatase D